MCTKSDRLECAGECTKRHTKYDKAVKSSQRYNRLVKSVICACKFKLNGHVPL